MHCFQKCTFITGFVGFQVNDLKAALEELKKNNIRTLSPEPRIGAHGKLVMFLHPKDCCGTLVELEQDH